VHPRDYVEIIFTARKLPEGCQDVRGHARYLAGLNMVGCNVAVTASGIQRLRGIPQLRRKVVTSGHVRERTDTAPKGSGRAKSRTQIGPERDRARCSGSCPDQHRELSTCAVGTDRFWS
jgi:hypothetical protein